MTAAATQFITPLSLQAVSGQNVHTKLFDLTMEAAMGHIELARWADFILIAPASANILAKLAYGHTDDLLTTLCLASNAPIILAPAMNQQMWQAAITQENCQRLQTRNFQILYPTKGSQACGETGIGRMLEPLEIIQSIKQKFQTKQLKNQTILITAGPTREAIDPVRFISNRSSGRMGYAIAESAFAQGAQVILISGAVTLSPPYGVKIVSVDTAQSMYDKTMQYVSDADIFIATAAVADYRPVQPAVHKIKKQNSPFQLILEPTPDILATVSNLDSPPFTVGFAAETENLATYAQAKLKHKKLDMIAANQVNIEGIGFDSAYNALSVFWQDGKLELPRCTKKELANQLMALIIQRYFK